MGQKAKTQPRQVNKPENPGATRLVGKPTRTNALHMWLADVHEIDVETWSVRAEFGHWTDAGPRHLVIRSGDQYGCDCEVAARGSFCAHIVAIWKLNIPVRNEAALHQLSMFPWQEVRVQFEGKSRAVRRG